MRDWLLGFFVFHSKAPTGSWHFLTSRDSPSVRAPDRSENFCWLRRLPYWVCCWGGLNFRHHLSRWHGSFFLCLRHSCTSRLSCSHKRLSSLLSWDSLKRASRLNSLRFTFPRLLLRLPLWSKMTFPSGIQYLKCSLIFSSVLILSKLIFFIFIGSQGKVIISATLALSTRVNSGGNSNHFREASTPKVFSGPREASR